MRLVKTTHKTLYEKSAFSKKAYHQRDDGFILLKTNCYYTDERGNTYFCFAGVGEFDIDSTKNINYDDVLDKNAFIDAKDNVALNYILDNASVIDKSYTGSIQNRLKVSDKKHTKIANALKEQELNVYNKEEINEKLENAHNDIQKLKDEIKALSSNYEKDLKQLQDKLSKNEQSIKNTIKAYKLNDDKKEALQDERINTLLNGFDDFVLATNKENTALKQEFDGFKSRINVDLDEFKKFISPMMTSEKLFGRMWDIFSFGDIKGVISTQSLSFVVKSNTSGYNNTESSFNLPFLVSKGVCFVSYDSEVFLHYLNVNTKQIIQTKQFKDPRNIGSQWDFNYQYPVGSIRHSTTATIFIFGFKE